MIRQIGQFIIYEWKETGRRIYDTWHRPANLHSYVSQVTLVMFLAGVVFASNDILYLSLYLLALTFILWLWKEIKGGHWRNG